MTHVSPSRRLCSTTKNSRATNFKGKSWTSGYLTIEYAVTVCAIFTLVKVNE